MKIAIGELKKLIKEALDEAGMIKGGLRRVRGSGGQQYKIGKVEDTNKMLSAGEADSMFPGSVDAWVEIVVSEPSLLDTYVFDDPWVIRKRSIFTKLGKDTLTVSHEDSPQVELATWNPNLGDSGDWVLRSDTE